MPPDQRFRKNFRRKPPLQSNGQQLRRLHYQVLIVENFTVETANRFYEPWTIGTGVDCALFLPAYFSSIKVTSPVIRTVIAANYPELAGIRFLRRLNRTATLVTKHQNKTDRQMIDGVLDTPQTMIVDDVSRCPQHK